MSIIRLPFSVLLISLLGNFLIFTTCNKEEDVVVADGPGEPITDIDGNTYETVWIGNKNWMTENLKVTTYNNGTPINLASEDDDWNNYTVAAYCWYENDQVQYGREYGALYNYFTVLNGNLCPSGWHVPSDNEWKSLEKAMGMSNAEANEDGLRGINEGSKLAGRADLWEDGNLKNNSEFGVSGFDGLPGGYRMPDGRFYNEGYEGYWWTSSGDNTYNGWRRILTWGSSSIYRNGTNKGSGFSVRCVKN